MVRMKGKEKYVLNISNMNLSKKKKTKLNRHISRRFRICITVEKEKRKVS